MLGIEIAAAVFGLLCVWLTVRQNIWCWPTGLVQVILFLVIFWHARLYSDFLLHIIYVILQFYGWYYWLHGKGRGKQAQIPVTVQTPLVRTGWIFLTLGGALGWGAFMNHFTDAAVPYGDAFTTVASLVAQWLLARKKLESWIFWITVDVVAIGIYSYKELYVTAALYTVFLVLATLGLLTWRKALNCQRLDAHEAVHP